MHSKKSVILLAKKLYNYTIREVYTFRPFYRKKGEWFLGMAQRATSDGLIAHILVKDEMEDVVSPIYPEYEAARHKKTVRTRTIPLNIPGTYICNYTNGDEVVDSKEEYAVIEGLKLLASPLKSFGGSIAGAIHIKAVSNLEYIQLISNAKYPSKQRKVSSSWINPKGDPRKNK